jgi:hypothetical protein
MVEQLDQPGAIVGMALQLFPERGRRLLARHPALF